MISSLPKILTKQSKFFVSQPLIVNRLSVFGFSTQNKDSKITPPPRSTTAEGFGKKFSEKEVEKLLDPMGFIKKDEVPEYEGLDAQGKLKDFKKALDDPKEKKFNYEGHNVKEHIKDMKEEVGFKHKGPEPTRYGDWEKKGRVSDF